MVARSVETGGTAFQKERARVGRMRARVIEATGASSATLRGTGDPNGSVRAHRPLLDSGVIATSRRSEAMLFHRRWTPLSLNAAACSALSQTVSRASVEGRHRAG